MRVMQFFSELLNIAKKYDIFFIFFALISIVILIRQHPTSIYKDRVYEIFQTAQKFIKYFILISCIIIGGCVLITCIFGPAADIIQFTTSSSPPPRTVTTTLFTTLMTVDLTLIALVVTAYIFLADSLSKRKEYEQTAIRILSKKFTSCLIIFADYTGVCVVFCLIADNGVWAIGDELWLRYIVAAASALDILFLIGLLYQILNYENKLKHEAVRKIQEYNGSKTAREVFIEDAVKQIGDLELIAEQIKKNHDVEFRNSQYEASLHSVLKKKLEPQVDEAKLKSICEKYQNLIELRNCVWTVGGKKCELLQLYIQDNITDVFSYFTECCMKEERFKNLNLSKVDFSGDKVDFTGSSWTNAAIWNTSMQSTKLISANFSGVLFQTVHLEGANCTNAVFDNAKFLEVFFSSKTKCEGAVFRNADFNGMNIEDPDSGELQFSNTSCNSANFSSCNLTRINFVASVFSNSTFYGVTAVSCKFDQCDFSDAVLACVKVHDSSFTYANMEGVSAASSYWHGDEKMKQKMDMSGVRIARANFSQSEFKYCNLFGVFANDVSLIGAKFEHCDFDWIAANNADCTNVTFSHCNLKNGNLQNILLIGQGSDTKEITGTSFDSANLTNAQICSYVFDRCTFIDVFFDNALLKHVTFIDCDFKGAQFDGTVIMHVDWKNCRNLELELFKDTIRFCIQEEKDKWMK